MFLTLATAVNHILDIIDISRPVHRAFSSLYAFSNSKVTIVDAAKDRLTESHGYCSTAWDPFIMIPSFSVKSYLTFQKGLKGSGTAFRF